jgi:hypothetical protein
MAAAVKQTGVFATRRSISAAPRRPAAGSAESLNEELLEAIRRWTDLFGEPPTLADWDASRARRAKQEWRAERWESGDWPTTRMVRSAFGTMSAAIRAAGLTPRRSPTRSRRHLASSDAVLVAISEWNRRYGEPPGMMDWDSARARRAGQLWRVARFYEGDWPSIATVRHHFGNLNQAIREAGLTPRARGQRSLSGRQLPAGRPTRLEDPHQQLLAWRVRSVALARQNGDPELLAAALHDLSLASLAWRDDLKATRRSAEAA